MNKPFVRWNGTVLTVFGMMLALLSACRSPQSGEVVFSEIPAATSNSLFEHPTPARDKKFSIGDFVTLTFPRIEPEPPPHEERVKEDGSITLPLIGAVVVTNKTAKDLEREIIELYRPHFPRDGSPRVSHTHDRFFYVGGEVRHPDRQAWLGAITVSQAIQAAGGFKEGARKTRVLLIRADGTRITVNCTKAIKHPELDPKVLPGDALTVPRSWWW